MNESMRRWVIAMVAALMNACQTGSFFFAPTTLMPRIISELGVPLSLSTLPIAVGKIVYVFLLVPGGMLVDKVGPRLTVLVGLTTLSAIMAIYAAFASTLTIVLVLHIAMAASAAISGVPIYSIFIAQWFTAENMGLAMGVVLSGYSAAGTLFPMALGPIADSFGWRVAMGAVVIMMIIFAIPISTIFLHENKEQVNNSIAPSMSVGSINSNYLEQVEDHPLYEEPPVADSKYWAFVGFASCYALLQYCNGCLVENIMFFLTVDNGFALTSASLLFSALNLSAFLAKLIGGHLGDRFDRFHVGSAASLIASLGIGLLFISSSGLDENYIPYLTSYPLSILGFALLYGFGYGACFNCLYALVPIVFGKADLGRTQSALFGIGLAGNSVGCVLTSVLRYKYDSYQRPFLVAFILCIANFFTFNIARLSVGSGIDGLKGIDVEQQSPSRLFQSADDLTVNEDSMRTYKKDVSDSNILGRSPHSNSNFYPQGMFTSSDALTNALQLSNTGLQATPRTLSFLNAETPETSSPYLGDPFYDPSGARTFGTRRGTQPLETGMIPDRGFPIPRDWSSSSLRRNTPSVSDLSTPILPPAASSPSNSVAPLGARKLSTLESMVDSGIFSASLESVGYLGTRMRLPSRPGRSSTMHIPQNDNRGRPTAVSYGDRQGYGATSFPNNFNNNR